MATVKAAGAAMSDANAAHTSYEHLVIRNCNDSREYDACLNLQRQVWGFNDEDLVPTRLFIVAQKIGGQVIGAFDGDQLVAFALGIPGNRNGHLYMHSHMLAVDSTYRNAGLGRKVKLFQREDALAKGVELIEWTFDPLEIKNAWLNIEKLGAIVRRYTINQYGMTSSALQGGLPTDRLTAEWWLKSKRVEMLLQEGARPGVQTEKAIEVPAEIYGWKASPAHRSKALEVQQRNRQLFLNCFDKGLAVLGYDRDALGNGKYLLGKWDENWSYAS